MFSLSLRSCSLNFIRLLREVFSSQQRRYWGSNNDSKYSNEVQANSDVTGGEISTRSNWMKSRLAKLAFFLFVCLFFCSRDIYARGQARKQCGRGRGEEIKNHKRKPLPAHTKKRHLHRLVFIFNCKAAKRSLFSGVFYTHRYWLQFHDSTILDCIVCKACWLNTLPKKSTKLFTYEGIPIVHRS